VTYINKAIKHSNNAARSISAFGLAFLTDYPLSCSETDVTWHMAETADAVSHFSLNDAVIPLSELNKLSI
jgi:hypothetical protein